MRNRIKNGIFSTPDAICLIKILLTIDLCNRHEHLLDFRKGSLREIPTARSLPRRWFKPIIRSFEHEVSFAKQSRANVTAKLHSLKHEGAIVFRDFKNGYTVILANPVKKYIPLTPPLHFDVLICIQQWSVLHD